MNARRVNPIAETRLHSHTVHVHHNKKAPKIKTAIVAVVLLAAASMVGCSGESPGQPNLFAGKWDGEFVDHLKKSGKGVYEFGEEKGRELKVKVSWKDNERKDHSMELTGERVGADAVRLKGNSGDHAYRYIGGMENGDVMLAYTERKGQAEQPNFGVSRLTRQKK